MMAIFESFLSCRDFPSFKQKKGYTVSAISKVYDCNPGIEMAKTRLSLDKRIQAVRIRIYLLEFIMGLKMPSKL